MSSHKGTNIFVFEKGLLMGVRRSILYSLFFILGHVSGGRVTVTDGNCRIYLQL